ncbi:MAG: virulence-associated E family protein [Bacteroidetes bacterium]|nr:virulence-associated E family protein [Bacteroidota bacterium]
MKVSVLNNFYKIAGEKEIIAILQQIKQGEYRTRVLELRKLLKSGNQKDYDNKKRSLPGFTPSGTFNDRRKNDNLKEYSQFLILDIDKVPEDKLPDILNKVIANPLTYAAFKSPSGLGLKILVKTNVSDKDHKLVFNQAKNYYTKLINFEIDPSGKDVSRMCFFSWDPDLYLNEEADVFIPMNGAVISDIDQTFQNCVDFTNKKLNFEEGSRNTYVHQLVCNCNRVGIPEENTLSKVLENFNFNEPEIQATVKSVYSNNATEHNISTNEKKDTTPTIDKIERFLNKRYEFRLNVVLDRVEFRPLNNKEFRIMTDYDERSIHRQMLKQKIGCSLGSLRNTLYSDFSPKYDPFIDYFESLPKWDNKTDHIHQLAFTVNTTNNDLWYRAFKKWLIAAVASVLDENTINHTVIIFSGPQGIGKTTWMQNLIPDCLDKYIFSGTINPGNKDTLIQLSECFLINMDELENMNRTEIGTFKETITKSKIRLRRPYGYNNENYTRRASFMGSVNTPQFLNDLTGSRRFLCFETTSINYLHTIELDKVYAQAYSLYNSGSKFYFDKSEIDEITGHNEQYQIKTSEEELLLTHFEPATATEATHFLSATDILNKLTESAKISVHTGAAIVMGKALKKHNFLRFKRNGRYVYAVKEISYYDVEKDTKTKPEDDDTLPF